MGLVHVRGDLQTTVGADGQMLVEQSHLIEVGFSEISADGTIYLFLIEQHVYGHGSVEDLVVACDTGLCMSVLECCRGGEVVEVHVAVFQQSHVCCGIEAALT